MVQVRIITPLLCFLFLGLTFLIPKQDAVSTCRTAPTIATEEFQKQLIERMENTSEWQQPVNDPHSGIEVGGITHYRGAGNETW